MIAHAPPPDASAPVPPGAPVPLVVGLLGPGQVGSALLGQLARHAPGLRASGRVDLRVAGVASSRRMRLGRGFEEPEGVARALRDPASGPDEASLDAFGAHLLETARGAGGVGVVVDCTASELPADHYARWLGSGLSVVSANKFAGAGPLGRWREIRRAATGAGTLWRAEATVGAGLPVLSTLEDLVRTGDTLVRVEGILSGTLAFLLAALGGGEPFQQSVPRARALGYTEPDPRDDLSGMDVVRKIVILAREAGAEIEAGQVALAGLVPPELEGGSVDAFLGRLDRVDAFVEAQVGAAGAGGGRGECLRYVGRFAPGEGARVGLEFLPAGHPLATLPPSANGVAFTTERYPDPPLVVQGPGAGPEVTAAGVFADLLRVAAEARAGG
jgi:bifunctional aspartokinase / homoserine dehydrogenase 1